MTDNELPVSLEFNDTGPAYAWLKLSKWYENIPNPQEYFLAPAARWNPETKEWEVIEYSFVHVSHLPTEAQLKEKMKGFE